jgi:hypothetical protein
MDHVDARVGNLRDLLRSRRCYQRAEDRLAGKYSLQISEHVVAPLFDFSRTVAVGRPSNNRLPAHIRVRSGFDRPERRAYDPATRILGNTMTVKYHLISSFT